MNSAHHDPVALAGLTPRTAAFVLTLVAAFLASSVLVHPATGAHRVVHLAAAAAMVGTLWSVSRESRRRATSASSVALVVTVVATASVVFATWTSIPGVSDYLWSWPLYMAGIIEINLCLKGRPRPAILIHVGVAAALALRAWQVDGTQVSAAPALGSYVPMFLVALLIALYVRPTVGEIAALRDAGETAGRATAVAVAVVDARNERLDWIDRTAGPWLRRIASGTGLDDEDRRTCLLLEASIRDVLRAPGLTGPELDGIVERARRRGVEVVLLDDGALTSSPPEARAALRALIAGLVDTTTSGRVTARIGPPDRDEVATILHTGGGPSGRVLVHRSDLSSVGRPPGEDTRPQH